MPDGLSWTGLIVGTSHRSARKDSSEGGGGGVIVYINLFPRIREDFLIGVRSYYTVPVWQCMESDLHDLTLTTVPYSVREKIRLDRKS